MLPISCVIIVVLVAHILYETLIIAEIEGDSMYPLLHDGDYVILSRVFTLRVGDIYAFYSPYGEESKVAIKKLVYFKEDQCFFAGINKEKSYDSYHYGFVNAEKIVGKLLWHKKH